MIKNMDLEHFFGVMVDFILVNGKMVNKMVKVNIQQLQVKIEKEYGKKVKE
jgi:hypothetical protein